jgi:hypothetical protein
MSMSSPKTYEKALPAGHPYIAESLFNLAYVQFRGRPAECLLSIRRATAIVVKRCRRGPRMGADTRGVPKLS